MRYQDARKRVLKIAHLSKADSKAKKLYKPLALAKSRRSGVGRPPRTWHCATIAGGGAKVAQWRPSVPMLHSADVGLSSGFLKRI